jgi:hypothetical protein
LIRISITSAAFEAIKATLPVGSAAYEPQKTAQGGYFVLVERSWLDKLESLRHQARAQAKRLSAWLRWRQAGVRAAEPPSCSGRRPALRLAEIERAQPFTFQRSRRRTHRRLPWQSFDQP